MKRIGKEQESAPPDSLPSSLLPTSRSQQSSTHQWKSSLATTHELKSPTPPPMFWRKAPGWRQPRSCQPCCPELLRIDFTARHVFAASVTDAMFWQFNARSTVLRHHVDMVADCADSFSDGTRANGNALKGSSHVRNRQWQERVLTTSEKVGEESERRRMWCRFQMFIRVVHCLNCCSTSYSCRNFASLFVRLLLCRVLQSVAGK